MPKQLTRAALLIAVALAVQGLRFLLPLPGLFTMFLIGSLVNMCLVLLARLSALHFAIPGSVILPCVAYLQGQLPFVPMIPVVFIGNLVLLLVAYKEQGWRLLLMGPLLKTVAMWAGTGLVLQLLHVGGMPARILQTMMSWPQLVTAFCGIILAGIVLRRVNNS
jgi:hypothetical protein